MNCRYCGKKLSRYELHEMIHCIERLQEERDMLRTRLDSEEALNREHAQQARRLIRERDEAGAELKQERDECNKWRLAAGKLYEDRVYLLANCKAALPLLEGEFRLLNTIIGSPDNCPKCGTFDNPELCAAHDDLNVLQSQIDQLRAEIAKAEGVGMVNITTDQITEIYTFRKMYEQAKKAYPAHIVFSYDSGRLFTFHDDARKVSDILHTPLGTDNKGNCFTAVALNDDLLKHYDLLRLHGYGVAIAEHAEKEAFKEAVQEALF